MDAIQELTKRPGTQLYFKESDLAMLKWVTEYQYLQPSHIQRLSGRNIVSIRRRLRQLYERGYLDRLALPTEPERVVPSPAAEYVYRLGGRGVALANHMGFSDGLRSNYEKSVLFLKHEVLISGVHVALELAARGNSNVQLVQWEQRRSVLLDSVDHDGERTTLIPDAAFSIKNMEKPADKNTTWFFLELVNTRQGDYEKGQSHLMRKLADYVLYYRSGRHAARWGIQNFRVVIIAPTPQRAQNLCRKLSETDLSSKRFWIADMGRYSLDAPAGILKKIFRTPTKDSSLYSLGD